MQWPHIVWGAVEHLAGTSSSNSQDTGGEPQPSDLLGPASASSPAGNRLPPGGKPREVAGQRPGAAALQGGQRRVGSPAGGGVPGAVTQGGNTPISWPGTTAKGGGGGAGGGGGGGPVSAGAAGGAAGADATGLRSLPADVRKYVEEEVDFRAASDPSEGSERPSADSERRAGDAADAGEGEDPLFLIAQAADLWSVGSALHSQGTCKPCHYAHTRTGCRNGRDCDFCHIPHTTQRQTRVSATRRRQCQRVAELIEQVETMGRDVPGVSEAVQSLTSRSKYLHGILDQRQRMKQRGDGAESSTAGGQGEELENNAGSGTPQRRITMSL